DRCPDPESPIRVLIEAQYLPGESHTESHQQKEHADDPGEFPRKLVRSEEEDLHHVDQNDGHHEIRAPSVQSADEPAESDIMVQRLETAPGFAGRKHVDKREQNPCCKLEKKDGECGAAK